eukprot:GEMP01000092.1.p1 GENE.GEMP01000092.1~~GEMP01000092.1.p1  ORF type:complete len:2939 (+),score=458.36 GEMP01000092.1:148-8817(+)
MNSGDDTEIYREVYHGAQNNFGMTSLVAGLTYRFRVTAINVIGGGPWSAYRAVTMCVAPSPVQNLRLSTGRELTSSGDISFVLAWDLPIHLGGCPVTSYIITEQTRGEQIGPQIGNEVEVPSTTRGNAFAYRVSAVSVEPSEPVELNFVADLAPPAVVLDPLTSTSGEVQLQWNVGTGTGYRIYRNNGLGGSEYISIHDLTATSFTVTSGLVSGRQYCFKVGPTNHITDGSPLEDQKPQLSEPQCIYASAYPEPPGNLYFDRFIRGEINVSWPPSQDDGGAVVKFYELSARISTVGAFAVAATNAAHDLTHVYGGCTEGAMYVFRVRATNAKGFGAYSSEVSAMCAIPPAVPVAPRRRTSTRTSIHLEWDEPLLFGAPITVYRLYRATAFGPYVKVYEDAAANYNSEDLSTSSIYRFRLAALNEAGARELSVEIEHICATLPSKLTMVTFTSDLRTGTIVSWVPPEEDGGAPIIKYEVYQGLITDPDIDILIWSGVGYTKDGIVSTDVITLTTGKSYRIQVAALNAVAVSNDISGTRSDIAEYHCGLYADMPGVYMLDSTVGSVTLGWTAPTDNGGLPVISYNIYTDDGLGGAYALHGSSTSSLTYVAGGLSAGYTYRFKVYAVTAKGEGQPAHWETLPCDSPGPVGNFHVALRGESFITLAWEKPISTGLCPLLGYTIYSKVNGGTYDKEGTTSNVEDVSFTFHPPTSNIQYTVKVQADNHKTKFSPNEGADSVEIDVISATGPSPVLNLRRKWDGCTDFCLEWDVPSSDGGAPITEYYVYRNDGHGGLTFDTAMSTPVTGTNVDIPNLDVGQLYAFKVAGVNVVVKTNMLTDVTPQWSNIVYYFAADSPGMPEQVSEMASTRARNGITIEWKEPSTSVGIPVRGYKVYRDDGEGSAVNILLYDGSTQPLVKEFALTGLAAGKTYKLAVTCLNDAGESDQAIISHIAGGFATFSDPPHRKEGVATTDSNLVLAWNVPDDGGSAITRYHLYKDDGNYGPLESVGSVAQTEMDEDITSLTGGKFYRFAVKAENAAGVGPQSPVLFTQACGRPAVGPLVFSDPGDNAVTVTWTRGDAGCDNEASVNYVVRMKQTGGSLTYSTVYEGPPSVLSYRQTNLVLGNTYKFLITMSNFDQTSDSNFPVDATYDAGAPPEAPVITFVKNPGVQHAKIKLSWTEPHSALPITGYELYHDSAAGTGELAASVVIDNAQFAARERIIDVDQIGQVFRFQMVAVNKNSAIQPGPRSGIVSFGTSEAPTKPLNFRYSASTRTTLTVAWDALVLPTDALPLKRYEVFWSDLTVNSAVSVLALPPSHSSVTPPSTLLTGNTIEFSIRACNINECGATADAIQLLVGALPEAPAKPFASAVGANEVTVSWTYVGRDTGGMPLTKFKIFKSIDSGLIYTHAADTNDGSVFSYIFDCDASRSDPYFLQIRAVNGVGGSTGMSEASETLGVHCSDGPPVKFNAPTFEEFTLSGSQLILHLPLPDSSQLNNMAHVGWRFAIDDMDDSDFVFQEYDLIDASVTQNIFTEGIVTGHRYQIKWQLCSTVGCGEWSDLSSPIFAADKPDPPTNLRVTSTSNTQIGLAWDFTGSNGGALLTAWKVSSSTTGRNDNWSDSEEADVGVFTFLFGCDGSVQEKFVWFRIAALNPNGASEYTPILAHRCSAVPAKPSTPVVLETDADSISISWNYGDLFGALYTGSILFIDDGEVGPYAPPISIHDVTKFTYEFQGLIGGRTYRIKVATRSEVGEGVHSDPLSAITAVVPSALIVIVVSTTNTKITLDWQLSSGGGGVPITTFHLYDSADGTSWTFDSPTQTIAGPTPGRTDYTCAHQKSYVWFKFTAINAVGEGPKTGTTKVRCSSPPAQPQAVTRVSSVGSTLTVGYQTSDLYDASPAGYYIRVDDGNGGEFSDPPHIVSDSTQMTYAITGLTPGYPYRVTVQVVSEVGASIVSPVATFVSGSRADPPSPAYRFGGTNSELIVGWTTDSNWSNGGADVTQFNVYASVDGTTWSDEASPQVTQSNAILRQVNLPCTSPTLSVSREREYVWVKVAAVTGVGVGFLTNSVRSRCSEAPSGPATPQKVSGTKTTITISFQRPVMNGAVQFGYIFYINDGHQGTVFDEHVVSDPSATEYTFTNLVKQLEYDIKFLVNSEVGYSGMSGTATIVCGAQAEAPSRVTYLASSTLDASKQLLSVQWVWDGLTQDNGGTDIQAWLLWIADTLSTFSDDASPTYTLGSSIYNKEFDCADRSPSLKEQWVYFKVAAKTQSGLGIFSPITRIFCANAPERPTMNEVSATTAAITIGWSENNLHSAQLLAYKIYMNDGQGGALVLVETIQDTSKRSYTTAAGTIVGDRPYKFLVTCVTNVAESAIDFTDTLTIWSCALPDKPNRVTRKTSAIDRITVQWTVPATNGCTLLGFKVYRDKSDDVVGNPNFLFHPAGDVLAPVPLEAETTGTTSGFMHSFKIEVHTQKGKSTSDIALLRSAGVPNSMAAPVQAIAYSDNDVTAIRLTWSVPNLNGGTAVGYKVYRNNGGGGAANIADTTCGMETQAAPQTCTITGLATSTVYSFRMTTINDVGESDMGSLAQYTAAVLPAKMDPPLHVNPTKTLITMTWTAPDSRGTVIFNYVGEVFTVESSTVETWSANGNAGEPQAGVTDVDVKTNAVTGKQYKFRVAGQNALGPGDWSEWSSVTTAPKGYALEKPQQTEGLIRHTDAPEKTKIKLKWTKFTDAAKMGGDIEANMKYHVSSCIWQCAADDITLVAADIALDEYEITGLTDGVEYLIWVQATNLNAVKGAEATIRLTVGAFADAPPSTTVVDSGSGGATQTWEATTENGGSPVIGYQVRRSTANADVWEDVAPTELQYSWQNIPTASTTFKVRAVTMVGNGAEATSVAVVIT